MNEKEHKNMWVQILKANPYEVGKHNGTYSEKDMANTF